MKATSNTKSDPSDRSSESQADAVLREWRESAFYWQKHADTIRTMFGPITQALIEDAQIGQGEVVLDVAGGAGEPSLTIAETVGPSGSVTYSDVAPEMVAGVLGGRIFAVRGPHRPFAALGPGIARLVPALARV